MRIFRGVVIASWKLFPIPRDGTHSGANRNFSRSLRRLKIQSKIRLSRRRFLSFQRCISGKFNALNHRVEDDGNLSVIFFIINSPFPLSLVWFFQVRFIFLSPVHPRSEFGKVCFSYFSVFFLLYSLGSAQFFSQIWVCVCVTNRYVCLDLV